jgi:trehalose/maltose hydrolase-like predicted phosphorylase
MKRNWSVQEAPFNPSKLGHHETIFTIGNGYVGIRGSFEEGYPEDQPLFLIHGLFNQPEGKSVPELAPVPNWLAYEITINEQAFSLSNGTVLGYKRTLDMHSGLLRREVLWQSPDGTICQFTFERFASMAQEHILASKVRIHALNRDAEVGIRSGWGQTDLTHWSDVAAKFAADGTGSLQARTTQADYLLGLASALSVNHADTSTVENTHGIVTSATLAKGETISLTRLVAAHTSRDSAQPLDTAKETLSEAVEKGYDELYAANAEAWQTIWNNADIEIDGDDFAQLAVRFTQYHLLIAGPRNEEKSSIGAKTLSGSGYKGHVFWDTELFALTPFIYSQPEVARNLLMYRYHLIEGARHKATREGFEGAMYPWESTDTGEETTPKWGDPHPVTGERERIWTGDREIHISSDIAFGLIRYWQLSGDDAFMQQYGAEILLDTAVFWGSRAEYNTEHERYEFSTVIGPDEYHENVDNSVFTNWMVRWHLQTALEVLDWLHANYPDRATALVAQLDLTDKRLAHWQDVINRIYIPADGDILVQFDGFFDLEYVDVKAYKPRVHSLQAIFGTRAVNEMQIIKQADVVMLLALFGDAVGSPDVIKANWDVYEPRCDHGSSLSAAMHSLVAARLGIVDLAYDYWQFAAGADLEDNKGNVVDGIHAANCGGIWQAVVLGFAGLRVQNGKLEVTPNLPPHWKRLKFSIVLHGERRQITITPDSTQIL